MITSRQKTLILAFGVIAAQLWAAPVYAQSSSTDKSAVRAERRAQGAEATRSFKSGEGDPKPEPKARVSASGRQAARQERKVEGAQAAREFEPGEGDPKPAPTAKVSRAERTAGRKASRESVAKVNKAGQIPSYGENYGVK
ncbi:hypothetical protein QTH87_22940 [Variovorax sp. J22P168]|uniref:hypothetical protein n=1 Tax=Variovorax jilinensis TaxID=3053513 RepID=UPI00257738EF|nr:hypothetical protein [Variovorax sp. J22P168]MDM0015317.1 hypothetical protein [Variovorax sp. J22P168]